MQGMDKQLKLQLQMRDEYLDNELKWRDQYRGEEIKQRDLEWRVESEKKGYKMEDSDQR